MASAHTSLQQIAAAKKIFTEDGIVVVCVFCAHMRSREGFWISPPQWLSRILQQEPGRISHTYCPDCFARYFPADRKGG